MSQENVSVDVSCSWESANEKTLLDAITVAEFSAKKRDEDGALTDMVELESCILLTQPLEENGNNDRVSPEPCSITLKLMSKSPSIIANLVVACEAKLIEVYGAHNEYLMTVSADLIDQVDDMAVYCADIAINQLTQDCTLKFARLSRPTAMWLYGIKVIWNVVDNYEKTNKHLGVNFESVEQRLRESHTQLSGKAENCKQFLKMYSSLNDQNKSALGLSDPLSLLSLLPGITRGKRSTDNSFLNFASQSFKHSGAGDTSKRLNSDEYVSRDSDNSNSHACSDKFERILERHLTSMENRIMKALDEKIAAMQQQQEQQLQSLISLILHNRSPIDVRLQPKDKDCSKLSDQDTKIEQAIKKMIDHKQMISSYHQEPSQRNYIGDTNENVLKNALMALKFNEVLEGTSHSANSTSAVQGNS